jgi:hypothetical protein
VLGGVSGMEVEVCPLEVEMHIQLVCFGSDRVKSGYRTDSRHVKS